VDALLAGIVSNAITACALAFLVWIFFQTRFFRQRPAERYVLALVLLVKLVSPPLFAFPLSGFPDLTASDVGGSAVDTLPPIPQALNTGAGLDSPDVSREVAVGVNDLHAAQAPLAQTSSDSSRAISVRAIAMMLCGGSLVGTTLIWLQLLRQWRRVRQVLRLSSPATEALTALLVKVSGRMGCRRAPRLCVAGGRIPPMLWAGSREPRIVLPKSLIERMDEEAVGLVLAHEMAHYLRRDHWANLFVVIVISLFWWHPAAWWARREVRASQELCCDALVLSRFERSRRCYAATMLETLEFLLTGPASLPSLASGFGEIHSLHRRFKMLADPNLTHRRTWWSWLYLATVVGVLPLSVIGAQQKQPASSPATAVESEDVSSADPNEQMARLRAIYAADIHVAESAFQAWKGQVVGRGTLAGAADSQHLKNTLLALDKHYWDAGSKGDGREIEKMLADEFVSISVLGRYGKGDAVAACARYRLGNVAIHDPQVIRIGQNNAVVTYAYDCKILSASGELLETRKGCRVTFVWEQRGGGWLIVFCHDNHGRGTGGPDGNLSGQKGEKELYRRQIEEATSRTPIILTPNLKVKEKR